MKIVFLFYAEQKTGNEGVDSALMASQQSK